MKTLHDFALERRGVWYYFDLVCATPHPSGQEALLAEKLKNEALKHGLQVRTDAFGNMRIDRKAAPGYEKAPCIIFQAHLDMVPQKTPGSSFDFSKDPLNVYVTDNKVHCNGETTLGADDGIGVALAMDLLTDDSITCGPIAGLFTREEEIGLNGARELPPEFLEGDYLLNLDSGSDDCFYAGCAGGVENFGFFKPDTRPAPEGTPVSIEICGLEGGHSGADIHLKRGNAHKIMAAFLKELGSSIAVTSLKGGSVVNAISRESEAVGVLTCPLTEVQKAAEIFQQKAAQTFNAPADFAIKVSPAPLQQQVWSEKFQQDFLTMLTTLPDGVFEFSEELDSVCTSCNLGVIAPLADGRIKVGCHPRSFDDAQWQKISESNKEHFQRAGGTFEARGPYPGWKFKADSRLLEAAQKACEKIYGKPLPVRTIHAGLEPGLFTALAPRLEMLSFAPAAPNCHTTEEYLEINSTEKVVLWLREIIKQLS